MYNKELKEQFIKEYTASISVRQACVSVFNMLEKYETGWGADICTRSSAELQPIVDELVGIRVKSKVLRVAILKDYIRWCVAHNVPGSRNGFANVSTDGIAKLKRQTVTSPLHLQVYLNQICEPESEETTDNIYRCYYWLAYGGFREEDILKVRTSDVDFANMVVRLGDEEAPIYREAIPAFRNCVNLTQFVYKHPNYSARKVVYKPRVEGDELIRGVRSSTTVLAMRVELSRRSKRCIEEGKTELKLSYYRVWISGLFYRMYERELAGLPVDFSSAAARLMEGKTYNLTRSRNTPITYQRKVANDYQRDYEHWKMTFN